MGTRIAAGATSVTYAAPTGAPPAGSRLVPDWRMAAKLRLDGRQAADSWLAANFGAISKRATADLPAGFL